MTIRALGRCHPDCSFCARDWWRWLRRRQADMARPRRGEAVSFLQAALTSVRPENDEGPAGERGAG